jgi:hypothetical protein
LKINRCYTLDWQNLTLSCTSSNAPKRGAWPPARLWVQYCHQLPIKGFVFLLPTSSEGKKVQVNLESTLCNGVAIPYRFSPFQDSSIGTTAGYGLDCRQKLVRFPAGTRDFSLPQQPDRLGISPRIL